MLSTWRGLIAPIEVTLKGERVTHRSPDSEPEARQRADTVERNAMTLNALRAARRPMTINDLVPIVGGSRRRVESALEVLYVNNQVRPIPSTKRGDPVHWVAL